MKAGGGPVRWVGGDRRKGKRVAQTRDLGKWGKAWLNVRVAYGRSVQCDAFPNRRTETLRPL